MVPTTAIIIWADWQSVVRGPNLVIQDTVWPRRSLTLGTALPLYRTGISLLSRERFLYIKSTNIFHYLIFA